MTGLAGQPSNNSKVLLSQSVGIISEQQTKRTKLTLQPSPSWEVKWYNSLPRRLPQTFLGVRHAFLFQLIFVNNGKGISRSDQQTFVGKERVTHP